MAATGTLLAPRVAHAGRRADVVLRGATVFDGTGAAGREVDVGFTGDRITDVGSNVAAGSIEIDLRGLALAPGFIDIHSHADLSLLINNNAESRIRQGVTLGRRSGRWLDRALVRRGVRVHPRPVPRSVRRRDRLP